MGSVSMASSKMLLLLFAIVFWASVEANPTVAESRELQLMRAMFEAQTGVMDAQDRDMHNWWAEYDILMANYRSIFAENVCHDPDMLNMTLTIIEAKIQKVRWGWTQKREQLDAIHEILHHEDYANVTGLVKVLNQYLEQQYDQMDIEGEHLDQEESEVAAAWLALSSHPCPCVWDEWGSWGLCSTTCGGGVSIRERVHEKEATNGGEECKGSNHEEESCQPDPCPIDCQWSEWSDWSACDIECGDGYKHSQRIHIVPALFGGLECRGPGNQTTPCNNLFELRHKIQEQAAEINRLESLVENRV